MFTAAMAVLLLLALATGGFALWYLNDVQDRIGAAGPAPTPGGTLSVVLKRTPEATRVVVGGVDVGPLAEEKTRTALSRSAGGWVRASRPAQGSWLAVAVLDTEEAVPHADSVLVSNLLITAGVESIQFTAPVDGQ